MAPFWHRFVWCRALAGKLAMDDRKADEADMQRRPQLACREIGVTVVSGALAN